MKRGMPMKRTAFKREGPGLHREAKPRAEQSLKPKVCTAPKCGREFTPARPLQSVCGPMCAKRKVMAEATAKRAEHRQRREAIKTIPKLIAEAQICFNRWIRARDHDKPCISCGKPPGNMSELHAGRDAGHYRSTGSASHLRFHEANCHAQCVKCNQWGAGMAVDYRIGLIARIGLQQVEALEADNAPRKWTHAELRGIRDLYRAKVKECKRQ